MTTHLISVVIPCFNSAKFLQDTVNSVLTQDYQQLEIILVDDGSTDDTAELMAELQTTYEGVHTISQANKGSAAARNLGISIARGQYILPLDADDLITNTMLTDCVAVLDAQTELALVYTDRQDFGDSEQYWQAGEFSLARLKYFNQLSYCALYRRELWQTVGGYKSNVSGFDDWDFWIAAALQGAKAYHLPKAHLLHRRHAISQLWQLLPNYESLYARIILNNAKAFSETEQHAAMMFLNHGQRSALLNSARFLFLHHYYRHYPNHLKAPCVS